MTSEHEHTNDRLLSSLRRLKDDFPASEWEPGQLEIAGYTDTRRRCSYRITIRELTEDQLRTLLGAMKGATDRPREAVIDGLVHILAARTNEPKEKVLRKALTLYGFALDAVEKGNLVAILDPDDVIVHYITDLEPA